MRKRSNLGLYFLRFMLAVVILVGITLSGVNVSWQPGLNLPFVSIGMQKALATTVVEVSVATSADDCSVYWNGSTWVYSHTAVYQETGYYSAAYLKEGGGYRFQGITVPEGVTITAANIVFVCAENLNTTTVNSTFTGEDVDDASTFSTLGDYQARRGTVVGGANNNYITSAQVNWDNIAAWTLGTSYTSPELKTIIQEIVNRGGWVSGNDMVIFWDDHDDRSSHSTQRVRSIALYDNTTYDAPLLHIEYTGGISSAPTVVTGVTNSIVITSANVTGNVTATGGANVTSWGTQFGTSLSYGSNVTNTGNQGSPFNWTDNLTALSEGTLYYYRAFAINSIGISYGGGLSLTTRARSLWGTTAEWTALKAALSDSGHSAMWSELQSWCITHLSDSCPSGNDGDSEKVFQYITKMMVTYHLTDNTTYANAALTWAGYVANNWDDWNDNNSQSWRISVNFLSISLSTVYYDLHDYMSSANRTALYNFFMKTDEGASVIYQYSNYNTFYQSPWATTYASYPASYDEAASTVGVAAMALNTDYSGSGAWLTFADNIMLHECSDFGGEMGAVTQGTGYFGTALGFLGFYLDAASRLRAPNVFTTYATALENAGYFPIYMTVYSASHNGTRIMTGDSSGFPMSYSQYAMSFEYLLAKKFGNGYFQFWADHFTDTSYSPFSLIWKPISGVTSTNFSALPLYRKIAGAGYMIWRESWGDDALTVLFKAGSSMGHEHVTGTFVIYKNGMPLTGDVGYAVGYENFTLGAVQSIISTGSFIGSDGILYGYSGGREPTDAIYNLDVGVRPIMSSVDATSYYIQVSGNMTCLYTNNQTSAEPGYPEIPWPQARTGDLTSWIRNVVIIPDLDCVVVYDNAQRANSNNQTNWKITAVDPYEEVEPPTWVYNSTNDTYVTALTTARLEMKMLEPASGNYTTFSTNFTGASSIPYSLRTFTPSHNVTIQNYLTVYSADNRLSTNNITIAKVNQSNCLGMIVTYNGTNRKDLILFSTDGNAVSQQIELGGTYTAADGGAYSFSGTKVTASFASSFEVMGLEAGATLPVVTTQPATLVEETTSTLNGNVTDIGGDNVTRGFQYDTDLTAPFTTNWSEGIAYGVGLYSYIPVLTQGDKYAFRAWGANSAGTSYGSILTFMTKPDPAVAFASSSHNNTWVYLTWNNGVGMTHATIRYLPGAVAPTDNLSGTLGWSGFFPTATANITGLVAGTQYTFRLFTYALEDGTWSTADGSVTLTVTTSSTAPVTSAAGDIGKVLLRNLLSILVAAGALLTVMRRPNDPVAWMLATIVAAVVITLVQTTL